MPADHGLRTNDQEVPTLSARPHPSQPHPEDPIPSLQPWVRIAPKGDLELVTQHEILKHDLPKCSKDCTDSAQERAEEAEHGAAPYQPTLRRRVPVRIDFCRPSAQRSTLVIMQTSGVKSTSCSSASAASSPPLLYHWATWAAVRLLLHTEHEAEALGVTSHPTAASCYFSRRS